MLEIILQNIIVPGAATILTFLLTRKKYKAEAAMSELSTVEKAITIWRNIANDLKIQQQETYAELVTTRQELEATRDELKLAYSKIDGLIVQVESIKNKLKD